MPAAVPAPALPPSAAAVRAPRHRVANRTGDARETPGPFGVHWTTGASGELAIDLANGGRVALEPETHAVLLEAEPAAVVLLSGALHAQLLPQGSQPGREPLRIVTAAYVLSIASAGELWLAQPDDDARRAPYAAVLAGLVELERIGSDAATPETLGAGQEISGSELQLRPTGPRTLAQAKQTAAKIRARASPRAAEDAADALSQALASWDAAERRADELLIDQRAAKQRNDGEAVHRAQRALVALAQEKVGIRRRVRLAFELAAARELAGKRTPSSELTALAARAASALPSGL